MLSDLPAALENAKTCLALARENGEKETIEMAKFDVDVIRFMISGTLDDFSLARLRAGLKRRLDHRELRSHSTITSMIAAMMFELRCLQIEPIEEAYIAIESEPDLRRRDQIVGTLVVTVEKFEGPKGLKYLVDRIGEDATVFSGPSIWNQDFINFLLSRRLPEYEKTPAAVRLMELERISSHSDFRENRYQDFYLNCKRMQDLRLLGRHSEVEGLVEETSRLANQIGSERMKVTSQIALIKTKIELKRFDEVRELISSIVTNSGLEGLPEYLRSILSNNLRSLAHTSELKEIVKPLKNFAVPAQRMQEITQQMYDMEKEALRTVAEKRRSAKILADVQSAAATQLSKKQSELSFFRKFAIISTIGMAALIPWLFLYMQQRKLNRANFEISEGQELLKDLHLRINRMERTESLGLMAGSIAHDFNNILVGVMGNAELLQLKQGDCQRDPFTTERINSIIGSAQKAADLARQMLAYSGRQQVTKKHHDLNHLIQQNGSLFESSCLHQTLTLDLNSQPIPVLLDANLFERSILNLITNASQASDKGSEITIRTGRVSKIDLQDSTMFGVSNHDGDFGFLDVIDHGKGISDSDREHIFEPFYTRSLMGKGLGLSVVYGMIKSHNGMIQCVSEPLKGTRFRVYLPISDSSNDLPVSQLSRQIEKSEPVSISAPEGKTVLVIDDEEGVLEVCKELLESANWRVLTAKDGSEGLEIAVRDYQSISCILMDIVLPDLTANEILIEMENKRIPAPVVLMSGFSKIQLEKFRERVNVVSILSKPFSSKDVLDAALEASRKTIDCNDDRIQPPCNSNFVI